MGYLVVKDKLDIEKNSRVHLAIIDNHLIELYQSAKTEEQFRILSVLRMLIQEKDAAGDAIAVSVLDWAIDRLLRS